MFSLGWLFSISAPPLMGKDKAWGKIRISLKNINISTPSRTHTSPDDHLYSKLVYMKFVMNQQFTKKANMKKDF